MRYKNLIVTGGAGFIGSALIRYGLTELQDLVKIVNLDALTYAANLNNLSSIANDPRYIFVHGDIRNTSLVERLCKEHQIDAIIHCAAESHVDRSIESPQTFLDTNIYGTFSLLEVVKKLPHIHFHHISTDEVYGSLSAGAFNENSLYRPNSPYAASKAASDHLVRAWAHTFGLSITISHCTNNYGPHQYDEKFIPRMILNCLDRKPLPVYGKGTNVRDWIYVDDHAEAVWMILDKGFSGETYDIGGECEKRNIDLLHEIIAHVADLTREPLSTFSSLITFVTDRAGHDFRYAINCDKIKKELGWTQTHSCSEGLRKTVAWYIDQTLTLGNPMTKKIVCVIPARLHSSRFPRKILAMLGGKPLIQRVWEAAREVSLFDSVVIAVDAKETADIVRSFGGEALMTSPDCISGTARLVELKTKGLIDGDIFVNWQGDEPFIHKTMIQDLLQSAQQDSAGIWTLKKRCVNEEEILSPHIAKIVCDHEGFALYFSRSPIPFHRDVLVKNQQVYFKHVGIYAFTGDALEKLHTLPSSHLEQAEMLEQLSFLYHGLKIRVHETKYEVLGIDLPEHLAVAEKLIPFAKNMENYYGRTCS
ncbi:MAG: dTDP-glucose 4,6-dehydratase [Rhabdochlamydiaceae bacterium]